MNTRLDFFYSDCSDLTRTAQTLLGLESARTRISSDLTRTSLGPHSDFTRTARTLLRLYSDSSESTRTRWGSVKYCPLLVLIQQRVIVHMLPTPGPPSRPSSSPLFACISTLTSHRPPVAQACAPSPKSTTTKAYNVSRIPPSQP